MAIFHTFLTVGLIIFGLYIVQKSKMRSPEDVLEDIKGLDSNLKTNKNDSLSLNDEYLQYGLFSKSDKNFFLLTKKVLPIIFAIGFLLIQPLIMELELKNSIFLSILGISIGYIYSNHWAEKKKTKFISEIEYFIPVVMERLVMAVQAGKDVLGALFSITDKNSNDPVSKLLKTVLEFVKNGATLDKSLNEVALKIDSSALRHAFIHLAMAYKEGGELTAPLRELSDSTQSFYQESVEEQIAKLPGKATIPLMITFAGLIICFVTAPLLQVLDIAKGVKLP